MGIKSTAKKYYKKFKKAFTRNKNNETVAISSLSRRGAVRRQTNVNNISEISGNGAVVDENRIDRNNTLSEQNSSVSNSNIGGTNEQSLSEHDDIRHEDTIDLLYYGIDGNNTLSGQELGPISEQEQEPGNWNELGLYIIPEENIITLDKTTTINYEKNVDVKSMVGEIVNGQYNNSEGPSNSAPIKEATKKVSTESLESNLSQNSIH
ncbi:MAG: hypothetical protein K5769_02995 [Pseudobutyrivibrio sp.]|nr:hypothetical protein [Pseudobutyrivibrio sp.]